MERVMVCCDPSLREHCPGFGLGVVQLTGFRNDQPIAAVDDLLTREVDACAAAFPDGETARDPVLSGVRSLYRAFRMDPTRYRPSPERLVRRVLRGKDLPRIGAAVDLCNLVSLRTRIPLGLYDAAKIRGSVEVRLGRSGERYDAITGINIGAEDRLIAADAVGPIGGPTSDAQRTSVEAGTTELLLLAFFPPGSPDASAEGVMASFRDLAVEHCGATAVWLERL